MDQSKLRKAKTRPPASLKGKNAARLDSDSPFGASDVLACLGGSYEELMFICEYRFLFVDYVRAIPASILYISTIHSTHS